jgi:hypothetical protein
VNSLKTMTLVAVMAAVAYGVFASLHKQQDEPPPPGVPDVEAMAPLVQMGGAGVATPPEATSTPQFVQQGPVSSVPTLPPGVSPPAAASTAHGGPNPETSGLASPLAAAVSPLGGTQFDSTNPAAAQYPHAGNVPSATAAQPIGASSAGSLPQPAPSHGAASPTYPTTNFPPSGQPGGLTDPAAHAETGGVATAHDAGGAIMTSSTMPVPAGGYDPQAGDLHMQFAQALEKARVDADTGRLAEAHLELSKWYDQPQLSVTEQRHLIDMLDRLAGTVIYSHKHHLLVPAYESRPGDTLASVAQAHQLSPTLLAKINGLDPAAPLPPGTMLKVLPGPFNAVVDLKNHRLTLFLKGRYAGRFPIGIGREQSATPGDFEVKSIIDNPTYPAQVAGAPTDQSASPFGRYWIDLGNQIGIHGTSNPLSVGRSDGQGCISLKDDDIEHIHDILTVGAKVLIRK